mmetsp:Transcript_49752/g.131869  ORF Transcript_49752/g.131869 Transcript_49752/m.131869 type:complete len:237 (+) Transcript_49752:1491-2201(+)
MTFRISANFRVKATACSIPTATAPNSFKAYMKRSWVRTDTFAPLPATSCFPRRDVGSSVMSSSESLKLSSSTQSPRVRVAFSQAVTAPSRMITKRRSATRCAPDSKCITSMDRAILPNCVGEKTLMVHERLRMESINSCSKLLPRSSPRTSFSIRALKLNTAHCVVATTVELRASPYNTARCPKQHPGRSCLSLVPPLTFPWASNDAPDKTCNTPLFRKNIDVSASPSLTIGLPAS